MKNYSSRLNRFEEKNAYRRLFFTIFITITIIFLAIFLGIPGLMRLSIFIGNLKSNGEVTVQDTTAPYPPRLEASYTATNSANVTISGYAKSGTTIEVFLNGKTLKAFLIGSDGQFIIPNVTLREGENKITARSKDTLGNTSQPSNPLKVLYKNKPPEVKISEPEDGQNFNDENKSVKVSGQTEIGSTIYINGRLVILQSDGSFSFSLPLNEGENILKIEVTDIAGNQTTIEKKVTYSP
ncbi:MAG: Ig-like domain-containing protein [Candidatus Gottesmanbacteria bacterium]